MLPILGKCKSSSIKRNSTAGGQRLIPESRKTRIMLYEKQLCLQTRMIPEVSDGFGMGVSPE
jgi:hypothetical protein